MDWQMDASPKHVTFDKNGYILIYRPNHPYANAEGYIREHRSVYEYYLFILFDEIIYVPLNIDIHHDNENVQDNRIINLTPKTRSQHTSYHNIGNKYNLDNRKYPTKIFCYLCDGNTIREKKKNNIEHWYKYENYLICNRCYNKLQYQKRKNG